MIRPLRRRTAIGWVAALAASLALAACGSGKRTVSTISVDKSHVVDVYSSLPLDGVQSAQTIPLVNGIKLALAQMHGRAGEFRIDYRSLDDATAASGQWDAAQTAANARYAASDPKAVYYIGEFNSGASEISIPMLNEAGLAEVSPASTYVGLTTSIPGASAAGEPDKYYPTGRRTFLRLAPSDSVQAAADLEAMQQAGCTRVAIANDGSPYGAGLAQLIELEKGYYHSIAVLSDTPINPKQTDFRRYAEMLRRQDVNCFEFAGTVADGGVQIATAVNAALPNAGIFGPAPLCTSSWTNAADRGVPASVDPKIECTKPTLAVSAYPGGRSFLAAYRSMYGISNPDPYALVGYEAMMLGIDAIKSLGPNGDNKADVLGALFAEDQRRSALGAFAFDKAGDTTLTSYGLYRVGPNGDPVFAETLRPPKELGPTSP